MTPHLTAVTHVIHSPRKQMSFSIMALVIGFVLGLVLTALILQIIFQVTPYTLLNLLYSKLIVNHKLTIL